MGAAMSDALPSYNRDNDHLRLLSIFHYIWGVIIILLSCFAIFYIVIGAIFLFAPEMMGGAQDRPPPFFGAMIMFFGVFALLIGWTTGILTVISGWKISQRRARVFSLVIAGISLLSVPLGPVLGIFTLIVLCRESVARQYQPITDA